MRRLSVLILCFISLSMFVATVIRAHEIKRDTNYSISNINYIKKNINQGKMTSIKAEVLQKILIGEWRHYYNPHGTVEFTKEGKLCLVDWAYGRNIIYCGNWKAIDDGILFQLEGTSDWIKCPIKIIEFKKYKAVEDAACCTYVFMIEFEKVEFIYAMNKYKFLEGAIGIMFN